MDLSRTRVVFRERSVIDVLDLALRFVVQHGRLFAATGAVVLPPFLLASYVLGRLWGPFAAWGFSLFAASLASAPFTVLASRLVFEDDVLVRGAIREGLGAAPRLLLLRLVMFVLGALGLAFFTAPGLWFLSVTLFVVEVAVLERAPFKRAITRSQAIVSRESGEAMIALLLLAVLTFIACVAADSGGRAIASVLLEAAAPDPIWVSGWSPLSLAGFWLFVPYAATARFLVYLDVRTKSEGWDIQTRFVALALAETKRAATETRSAA